MKALITENLSHYLIKSINPTFPFDNWNAEEMSKSYSKDSGIPLDKSFSLARGIMPNMGHKNFQGICSSARLIFDHVNEFSPCNIINSGVDGLYGFQSKEVLFKTMVDIGHIHDHNPNILLSEEDIVSFMGSPMPIEHVKYLNNFVPNLNVEAKENPIILSRDSFYTSQYLAKMNVNTPEGMLAVLATAGISFCLPGVYAVDDEMVATIKETFSEELQDYKIHLNEKIEQVRAGVSEDGADFGDIWEYADAHLSQELKLKAERIEIAVSKADKKVKAGLWEGVKGSVPEIGSAMASNDGSLKKTVFKEILKVLCSGFRSKTAYEDIRKEYPEAAYLYQIRKMGKG